MAQVVIDQSSSPITLQYCWKCKILQRVCVPFMPQSEGWVSSLCQVMISRKAGSLPFRRGNNTEVISANAMSTIKAQGVVLPAVHVALSPWQLGDVTAVRPRRSSVLHIPMSFESRMESTRSLLPWLDGRKLEPDGSTTVSKEENQSAAQIETVMDFVNGLCFLRQHSKPQTDNTRPQVRWR